MQLSSYGASAQTDGMEHTQAFQMQMNAKMFSILTDKLYTNKEGAVIRELSANARDAHVAAGNPDKPFDLKLPSWLSNDFYIRDYGTGIDPAEFYDIYTNLGYSTKDGENNSIGAYGLGSKTPFAITDTYTIENFWNGTQYVYTAFKDEGMPTVSLVGSQPTDLPNGLKIKVTAGNLSRSSFAHEAKRQLEFFKVKPTIIGDSDWEWLPEEDMSKGYYLGARNNRSVTVIMGGIPYSANLYDFPDERYRELNDFVGYTGLTILAELGDVDIPPSREALELTDKTCDFIINKIEDIRKTYSQDFIKDVEKADNLMALAKLFGKVNPSYLSKKATYTFKDTDYDLAQLRQLTQQRLPIKFRCVIRHNRRKLDNTSNYAPMHFNSWMGDRTVYVNDIKVGIGPLIDQEYQSLDIKSTIAIPETTKKDEFTDKVEELKKTLTEAGISYKLLSSVISYTPPVRVKGARTNKVPDQIMTFEPTSRRFTVSSADEVPEDGYYVPVTGFKTDEDLEWTVDYAIRQGYTVTGLRSRALKKAEKAGKIKHLSTILDKLKSEAKEFLQKDEDRIAKRMLITKVVTSDAINEAKRTVGDAGLPEELKVLVKAIGDYTITESQVKTSANKMLHYPKLEPSKGLSLTEEQSEALDKVRPYGAVLNYLNRGWSNIGQKEAYQQLFTLTKDV